MVRWQRITHEGWMVIGLGAFILFVCLIAFNARASHDGMPAYLKDAHITVHLKNGKVYVFDANEWKVVKRGAEAIPVTEYVEIEVEVPVEKIVEKEVQVEVEIPVEVYKKHRLAVYAGWDASKIGDDTDERRNRPVAALGYDYLFNPEWSVNSAITSNNTLLLGLGFDF